MSFCELVKHETSLLATCYISSILAIKILAFKKLSKQVKKKHFLENETNIGMGK